MSNIIAIVGRPNVGKSTLFNRLVGQRKAIIDNEIGITRDRHYGQSEWTGTQFTVIDTGGYVREDDGAFNEAIRTQVSLAIDESDVVLFVVDYQSGVTGYDQDFANEVRKSKKPVFLVVNKSDDGIKAMSTGEFYALGMGDVYPVSAQNGSGTGELLDQVVKHLKSEEENESDEGIPKVAIVGRPNVGKSSLLNVLIGTERSIVSDIAGTTRDAINTRYNLFDKEFILIDTAGVRKKNKVKDNIEFYSVLRSLRTIENCDVCVLMIDAQSGLESQDMNLLRLAQRNNKGIVILVNKWDLVEKSTNTAVEYEKMIKEKLKPQDHIPVLFVSALTKQRVFKAVELVLNVYESSKAKISTSKLNDTLLPYIQRNPPPALKGKYIKIKYITQLPSNNTTFAFFCNHPQYIKEPYERFLENKIRSHFGFDGVPIKLVFRKK